MGRVIPKTNSIVEKFACQRCLDEIPDGVELHDYLQMEVGLTAIGLQIWCKRHEENVAHIDFQGRKHPARM